MKAKIMDAGINDMNTRPDELYAAAKSAARSQYPLVVTLWVMFLALVVMANPG